MLTMLHQIEAINKKNKNYKRNQTEIMELKGIITEKNSLETLTIYLNWLKK